MSAWEEWCSIRVKYEFIAFPHLQELHLDVLLKYQDQHRALLGPLKISNFLKQSFMQFCRLLVLTKLRLLQHSTDVYPIITFFGDYYEHCKHWNNGENL
ncbi:hypothetical protein RGQ29_016516 [Quercus rubra]|uniref:Uncharacterized protein n=1 Tax=Quercus rubra TaxID=3512 RepID=A0AAN7IWJ5_QUERU|nr:hypothetical protein RGQ29_016516 [Quercus rubra]